MTIGQKVPKLNSRRVYCSRLYGIFQYFQLETLKPVGQWKKSFQNSSVEKVFNRSLELSLSTIPKLLFFMIFFSLNISKLSKWGLLEILANFVEIAKIGLFWVFRIQISKVKKIQSHHFQWKFKLFAGKFTWVVKAKHCWVMSTNFLFSKVCWHRPAKFCFYTSSKLSRT